MLAFASAQPKASLRPMFMLLDLHLFPARSSGQLLRLNPRARLSPAFCFVGSPGRFLETRET
jgi:hypothetical protein